MDNYYSVLGVPQNATIEQIRRAYRILARRYHPDVNPISATSNSGNQQDKADSTERFRKVSEAYQVLSNELERKKYDERLSSEGVRAQAFQAYERARTNYKAENVRPRPSAQSRTRARTPGQTKREPPFQRQNSKSGGNQKTNQGRSLHSFWNKVENLFSKKKQGVVSQKPTSVSVIELSVSFEEAAFGSIRKVSVQSVVGGQSEADTLIVLVPKSTRDGSLIRASHNNHEYLCLVRVLKHPQLSLQPRGLIAELPVTLREIILGAIITAPGVLEENEVTVVPGSQSGTEIRLEKKGLLQENGERGDSIYRIVATTPTCFSAAGISQAVENLERYREEAPRHSLGPRLLVHPVTT